jgi:hypothetical protein
VDGQDLRAAGKLAAARDAFTTCSNVECPALVVEYCVRWLRDVVESLPSVVLSAKSAEGQELRDVRVLSDGKAVSQKLDGMATPLDPGPHRLRFERDGFAPIEEDIVLHAGEKNRAVTVRWAAPPPPASSEDGRAGPHAPGVLTIALAGLSAVAFGTAGYFGLRGLDDVNHLHATCAPACSHPAADSARRELVVSDVAFAAGVVALGAAVWSYVASSTSSSKAAAASVPNRAPSFAARF